MADMRRVSVVGNSGSGKSTLARRLAARLDAPYVELDAMRHQANWEPLPAEEMRRVVGAAVDGDRWVVDGNYSEVRELVWARADTVIWLDPPRFTVMRQLVLRSLRRAAGRVELWNGNRERWRNLLTLDPKESVVAWAWTKHHEYRKRFTQAQTDPTNAHLHFIHLTSRAESTHFFDTLNP